MKRASYRHGVEIISLSDDGAVAGVKLLAALFGLEINRVARDVAAYRRDAAASRAGVPHETRKRTPIWSRA